MRLIKILIEKIYRFLLSDSIAPYAMKVDVFLEKHFGKLYANTIGKEKKRINYGDIDKVAVNTENAQFEDIVWKYEKKIELEKQPLVSVIVPNYNHALYLEERLESIYNQSYKNFEVILLDDCSKDNSVEILNKYAEKYKDITTTLFNEKNVGKVFKQWNKGLQAAKGELIWIAESDDYCQENFLEEMVKQFCYESVMIAFARSEFVQEGKKIWSTEEYLSDLSMFRWDKPFVMTAAQLVKHGFAYKNMIPNVSSAVFRNIGQVPEEVERICGNLSLCGDWIFYLSVMKGGTVAYTNETINFYRVHSDSTSLRIQRTKQYYEEFETVSKFVARNYIVKEGTFEIVLENLKAHCRAMQMENDTSLVEKYYNINEIYNECTKRTPNILMGCYSLIAGGGETYPLYLANEMKKQGLSVCLVNFNMADRDENIRKILNCNVPLITLENMDCFYTIIHLLEGEIMHSHHGSVDVAVSCWKTNTDMKCKQFISLHGMYESLEERNKQNVLKAVTESCKHFAYTADKNLIPFIENKYYEEDRFTKIDNGLPEIPINEIKRSDLGIEDDAFVLCLVSRGIPEKGWEEGIRAVENAQKRCNRPIHLIIIGDGEIRKELEKKASSKIHFLGIRNNIRDYFSISDVGFLPSRFPGESYPLVVADSLICGKPVIATDIAEIRNQLTDEQGVLAGKLVTVNDWVINEEEMENAIVELVENSDKYAELQERTLSASKKFDITEVVHKYLQLYKKA